MWDPSSLSLTYNGFNPHPPFVAGAMGGLPPERGPLQSFNPHPPFVAGAILSRIDLRDRLCVSILTRHSWRVLFPESFVPLGPQKVSILTRHSWRVLFFTAGYLPAPFQMFQSSPAIRGGCYHLHLFQQWGNYRVSILTRHSWRVLSDELVHAHGFGDVSILTRHSWRVLWGRSRGITTICGFQSSPAIRGGCYRFVLSSVITKQNLPKNANPFFSPSVFHS